MTSAMTILAIGSVAVGAGTAAYGAAQTRKGQKANAQNARARLAALMKNEARARELYDEFIGRYNESSEKLEEGLTLEQYINNAVTTLGDPELQDMYRKARRGDWDQAQQFADMANKQNLSAFDMMLEVVSGGDYKSLMESQNKVVLSETAEENYKEARRLQATKMPAGSVVRSQTGGLQDEPGAIVGQRADKKDFINSQTSILQQNERTFNRARQLTGDYRVAALSQQEKASSFMNFLDFGKFATENVLRPFTQNSLAAGLEKLRMEGGIATSLMAETLKDPEAAPVIDTAASQALTAEGVKTAIGGLASIYGAQTGAKAPTSNTALQAAIDAQARDATNQSIYRDAINRGVPASTFPAATYSGTASGGRQFGNKTSGYG